MSRGRILSITNVKARFGFAAGGAGGYLGTASPHAHEGHGLVGRRGRADDASRTSSTTPRARVRLVPRSRSAQASTAGEVTIKLLPNHADTAFFQRQLEL